MSATETTAATTETTAAAPAANPVAKTAFFDDKFKSNLGTAFKTGLTVAALVAPVIVMAAGVEMLMNRSK